MARGGRSSRRGRRGGGVLGGIVSVLAVALVAVLVVAWVKASHITSVSDIYRQARTAGSQVSSGVNSHIPGQGASATSTSDGVLAQKAGALPVGADVSPAGTIGWDRWPHWLGSPCDTRSNILKDRGSGVSTSSGTCAVTGGQWQDGYSGSTLNDPHQVNLDFVVPPSYAVEHGGGQWSDETRAGFVNDEGNVSVVSAASVQSRAGRSPASWLPSGHTQRCTYVAAWVDVVSRYGLNVSAADRSALVSGAASCPGKVG